MEIIRVNRVITIGHCRNFVTCGIFMNVEEAVQDVEHDIENELFTTFGDDYKEEYSEQTEEYRSCLDKDEIKKALENGSGSTMVELPNGSYYDIQWAETEINLSEISTDILEAELKRRAESAKNNRQSIRSYWHGIGKQIEHQKNGEEFENFRKRVAQDSYLKSTFGSNDGDFEAWWKTSR